MAKATMAALYELRRPEDVARIRGKQISEVLPLPKIEKLTAEEQKFLDDVSSIILFLAE
jgi:hypothetical protein